jgi:hypothetical protein
MYAHEKQQTRKSGEANMEDKQKTLIVDESSVCFDSGALPHFNVCQDVAASTAEKRKSERILVLGAGCPKCRALQQAVLRALDDMNENISVGHVTDYAEMAQYGVMSTPALVIDGRVVSAGRALSQNDVLRLLKENL